MQEAFEFFSDNTRAGFRLHRMEVYNWGTFNKQIWSIEPLGYNSLLTGDIGSGKSTLVDAVTTLLVPHHKIIYNKAAGSSVKERDIKSYFYGEYKNERNELNDKSKSVYLRGENDYSVLLAVFGNTGYEQLATLAQVFYSRDGKVEKFFVFSDSELSIYEHFSGFGTDILQLKKNLRKLPDTSVYDNFKDYSQKFRSVFGIKSDKALDLFYQTVSMKAVGNLTDFVRNQMLEKPDVSGKILELRRNFENLTQSHEAILKARNQLQMLDPLLSLADEYEENKKKLQETEYLLQSVPAVFASMKKRLLITERENILRQLELLKVKIAELTETIARLNVEKFRLMAAIDSDETGRRISEIIRSIEELEKSRSLKLKMRNEYEELASAAGLSTVSDSDAFLEQLYEARILMKVITKASAEAEAAEVNLAVEKKELEQEAASETKELESLLKRRTQIPDINLKIREQITRALNIPDEEMPFAGELMRVRESEAQWEGAAERILHNFALSLLVRENDYKRVSAFVNATDLKGRIVFYRIPEKVKLPAAAASEGSLVNKLEIRADSAFHGWLMSELQEKYNYECCGSMDDFFRHTNAVTRQGQIKSGRARHEKDDRRSISDRRTYVLGWSNADKIRIYRKAIEILNKDIMMISGKIDRLRTERAAMKKKETVLHDLLKFEDFSSIAFEQDAVLIEKLQKEREALEKTSDYLKTMRLQLENVNMEMALSEAGKDETLRSSGSYETRLANTDDELAECTRAESTLRKEELEIYEEKILSEMKGQVPGLNNILEKKDEVWNRYDRIRTDCLGKERRQRESIIKDILKYKNCYPGETSEADPSVEAVPEFRAMAVKLKSDDLPKFEKRFRELLNEKTIQDIVLFKNQLEQSCTDIKNKIKVINRSLCDIEYEKGTFIELINSETADNDVKTFRGMLRNALEGTLGQGDLYSEEKFYKVKEILDLFNSGETADINWTARVTDVRNWFIFSASEKWAEDLKEKEYFSDSSGKSGGQKEKLAYTILASALAYQFGLERDAAKSRSFRFVVIDEAFGRGSDESTRYALELFRKMNLQLLIITPLQKINVIEDYINGVHFIHNRDGRDSVVRNISIDEYRREKEIYNARAGKNDFA